MHGLDQGFHWRDGWYFKREDGGRVRITRADPGHELVQIYIPALEWASIIAAVGLGGETSERYTQALNYHGDGDAEARARLAQETGVTDADT